MYLGVRIVLLVVYPFFTNKSMKLLSITKFTYCISETVSKCFCHVSQGWKISTTQRPNFSISETVSKFFCQWGLENQYNATPQLQPGWLGHLFLSGLFPLTHPVRKTLPAGIFLRFTKTASLLLRYTVQDKVKTQTSKVY